MSPITKEFTKEQLQQIIETDHVQCGEASALARIALASLEAEAVADVVAWSSPNEERTCDVRLRRHDINPGPLYTAPPAPISVPDEIPKLKDGRGFKYVKDRVRYSVNYANGWNACRAAMLQSADGALTNEDTKKMDELVMWIKRLAHSLRKASPDSKLQSDAMDYLSRKGLIGVKDILR